MDNEGVMWVIDKGATNGGGTCPPKIVLLDLKRNGKKIMSVNVPNNIASNTSFMNDIVLDTEKKIAYIGNAKNNTTDLRHLL